MSNNYKEIAGIPDDLDLEALKEWVKGRVSAKRYKHIKGVAKAGKKICKLYRFDFRTVELACWLHDSCKEIKADTLVSMAEKYGIGLSEMDRANGHILHGPVAAQVVKEKFSITNHDVLSGIAEHTLGGVTMTTASKIVYLADTLEESRPESLTKPIWHALSQGKSLDSDHLELDLDGAILTTSDLVLSHLLEKGKPIHLKAVEVRNHFLTLQKNKN